MHLCMYVCTHVNIYTAAVDWLTFSVRWFWVFFGYCVRTSLNRLLDQRRTQSRKVRLRKRGCFRFESEGPHNIIHRQTLSIKRRQEYGGYNLKIDELCYCVLAAAQTPLISVLVNGDLHHAKIIDWIIVTKSSTKHFFLRWYTQPLKNDETEATLSISVIFINVTISNYYLNIP